MDTINLTIESVEPIKTGHKKSGEPYTLSRVMASGKRYGTFLDLKAGETANFLVKTEKNGKYTNYTIHGYANQAKGPAEGIGKQIETLWDEVRALKKRVAELELGSEGEAVNFDEINAELAAKQ